MTTITPSLSTHAAKVADFKAKNCCPFTGTFKKPYDLESPKEKSKRPLELDLYDNLTELDDYLATKKTKIRCGEWDVVVAKKLDIELDIDQIDVEIYDLIYVHRLTGRCVGATTFCNHSITSHFIDYLDGSVSWESSEDVYDSFHPSHENYDVISALIKGNHLLLNADEGADENVNVHFRDILDTSKYPTVSFACLANLIKKEIVFGSAIRKILFSSKIEIVDFSPESKIEASAAIKKSHKSKKSDQTFVTWASQFKPIEAGYTLISSLHWHKSATIVIRNGKTSFLTGQDEGTYFGCILADNPKTVSAAYTSLMPKEVRGVKGVMRQGEWFAVPVKKVPENHDPKVLMFGEHESDNSINFPIDNPESNIHKLYGHFIITKNGKFYAKDFRISHNDHADLVGSKNVWYTFLKNTAVASFSMDKVD